MNTDEKAQPMSESRLAEIEARDKARTEGAWKVREPNYHHRVYRVNFQNSPYSVCDMIHEDTKANAEFIAHAATDIPDLVAEVKRLQGIEKRLLTDWHTYRRDDKVLVFDYIEDALGYNPDEQIEDVTPVVKMEDLENGHVQNLRDGTK